MKSSEEWSRFYAHKSKVLRLSAFAQPNACVTCWLVIWAGNLMQQQFMGTSLQVNGTLSFSVSGRADSYSCCH